MKLTKTKILILLAAAVIAASCTPAVAPPPVVTPQGEDRFLIDPRIGYTGTATPVIDTRFDAAWRYVLAGDEAEARRRLSEILTRAPEFLPAVLAGSALDIRAGRFDDARRGIDQALQKIPDYTAARVYEAEIAVREQRTRVAYDLYRAIAAQPNAPPTASERLTELQGALFNELYAAAQNAPAAESIRLLREALALQPGAVDPRIRLGQVLVEQKQFDEARKEIDPLLDVAADRPEVQEILAEIDVGRGRYQEAIVRYDRLARRTQNERYARRLEDIKQEWSAANMPPAFRAAVESPAITRADLAILLYWTVPTVRFAQNLGTPPIAIDISDVVGREEIIRAIAIGLYDVDPITRRVNPMRSVTAARFSTYLARVLALRGAPCARGMTSDKVLAACGVSDPLATIAPDALVSGRDAEKYLQEIAKKF